MYRFQASAKTSLLWDTFHSLGTKLFRYILIMFLFFFFFFFIFFIFYIKKVALFSFRVFKCNLLGQLKLHCNFQGMTNETVRSLYVWIGPSFYSLPWFLFILFLFQPSMLSKCF